MANSAAMMAALGALQTLAYVHTQSLWWLPLLCSGALAAAVSLAAPRQAALLGGAYASAWLVAGTWWLYISMHRYGGLPAPLAALAVLALCTGLALLLALGMAAVARWRSGAPLADAMLFASAWLAAELARGSIFTGFPWLASGYAQVDGPLAWLAPWVGVYAMGAIGAGLAALVAQVAVAWRARASRPAASRAAAWTMAVTLLALTLPGLRGPVDFTQDSGSLRVALLQTNVAQDEKFAQERLPAALEWVASALLGANADLVVAPETAVPLLPDQLAELLPDFWPALAAHFGRDGAPAVLLGVPLGDVQLGYSNAVVALTGGLAQSTQALPVGAVYRYDKSHLVPFGEFIPTGFHWFTAMMNIPLGDFNRGQRDAPSFAWRGQRIAPNICFEDLFGEELAQRFADPASAPTMLVNVSNIGWFGDTVAIPQHLNISRMRSLELQRPMLRATNTGATAVIDHRGRVQAQLAPFTRSVLEATVQGRQGSTPFARWAAAAGLWPLAALAALGLGAPAWRSARRTGRAAGRATPPGR